VRAGRAAGALVLAAFVVFALTPAFVARNYVVPSGSMETTVHGIKRVIAPGGQTVDELYIYVLLEAGAAQQQASFGPARVPKATCG
jgi:hypothetical protein